MSIFRRLKRWRIVGFYVSSQDCSSDPCSPYAGGLLTKVSCPLKFWFMQEPYYNPLGRILDCGKPSAQVQIRPGLQLFLHMPNICKCKGKAGYGGVFTLRGKSIQVSLTAQRAATGRLAGFLHVKTVAKGLAPKKEKHSSPTSWCQPSTSPPTQQIES